MQVPTSMPESPRLRSLAGLLPAAELTNAGASDAASRLRILATVTLVAFAIIGLIAVLASFAEPRAQPAVIQGMSALALKMVLASGAMLWALRRAWPPAVLDALTAAYAIATALCMAMTEQELTPVVGVPRWGVSGIGIWIVLVPLVYPFGPRAAALVATGCASSVLVAYGLSRMNGLPALPLAQLIEWLLPLYFCAGLATAAAFSIHRYRAALDDARQQVRELGRYHLERRLGAGGMGEVWLARHRLLPRAAAIKFIRQPKKSGNQDRARLTRQFEAEAAAISRLSAVNTVTLYDFGVSDQGEWYYVMELLDGIDLQQAVERHGPLSDWRVARILAQACRSLSEAHQQGLVHRDLKPGNVMLCRLGDEIDVVKVLDFGLVQVLTSAVETDDSVQLAPGMRGLSQAVGTPGYMAPEVLLGNRAPDHRADLYALGCLAWWLLTGRLVFDDAPDLEEECVRHCSTPPPLERLATHCDPDFVELIGQLLAKAPEERPVTADALRRRLLRLACWFRQDDAVIAAWWRDLR